MDLLGLLTRGVCDETIGNANIAKRCEVEPVPNFFFIGLAFAITLLMAWVLIPVARHIGLVDRPNTRKHHSGHVPLVGGMAMFCGFSFAVLALGRVPSVPQRAMLAGILVLVIAGVLDDLRELAASSRIVAQVLAGFLMVLWGGVVVQSLGEILFPKNHLGLSVFAMPLTVFAVVGGINALNWSDGLDGLAGGLALIALVPVYFLAWHAGSGTLLPFIGITIACLFAFWLLNMRFPWQKQARVFMGDSGSMFVGFLICWFLADVSQQPGRLITPVTALYLFAIPLLDTIFVIIRRWRNGVSPMAADRMHLHHLLQDMGFSPGIAVTMILAVAAGVAVAGVVAMIVGFPEYLMFYGFIVMFIVYYLTCTTFRSRVAEYHKKIKL
jgi:UDP-GlcNAc:undecaprenyl-phosphate GlcNAc-1-phosphate transferase